MSASNGTGSMRLVIIDQDKRARNYVKRCITDKGVRVIGEADDLTNGIRLVRALVPDAILLELPAAATETMEAVKKIREEHPHVGVILTSYETSPQFILSCLRAGAHEFVARPIDAAELEKAVDHLRQQSRANPHTNGKRRGTMLAVFSGKGGNGATSTVANLGVALADRPDTKTVVVDLSFQMGDLGLMLDHPPKYSIVDAFVDGKLDETKLWSIMSHHSSGVYILTAAVSPEIGEEVTRDHVVETLGALATMFDYTIIDVGRHLDDRTLEALEVSDGIFMMSAQDIPTVRNVSRYLDIFEKLNMEEGKIKLIVNRFHKKSRLSLKDLESALGMEAYWTIPNDFEPVSMGIDGGNPAVLEAPRAKVAQSFKDFAECVCETYGNKSPVPLETTVS